MMFRQPTALAVAALLCIAAAPTQPTSPKPAAAKPAGPRPAASRPAPKPAASSGAFDMRDPVSLVALLKSAGATAQIGRKDEDSVMVGVTSVAANFSVQFAGCERSGRNCKAMLFDAPTDGAPTFAQLNAFDQTSATCRSYQDRAGKAHVAYSTLLFVDDTREHATTQLAAWQGCLAEFHEFLKDPNAYLATAP